MTLRILAGAAFAALLSLAAAADARAADVRPPGAGEADAARAHAPAPADGLPDAAGPARIGGGFTPAGDVDAPPAPHPSGGERAATGGAQTLDDILARQAGTPPDEGFRRNAVGDPAADPGAAALGTLGGASDAEIWRALRYDSARMQASNHGPAADVIMQDGGMTWLDWRRGPVATWGGYALLGTLGLLAVFFLLRGRIRIDGEKAGFTVPRFAGWERFGHWLLAGSFVVLAFTGLWTLFGRLYLMHVIGKEAYAPIAAASKWVHNNLAWAFMLALVWVFVAWVAHNIPNLNDLRWIRVAGGLFSKNVHPPADKFNAGQKIVFWSVIGLGVSVSVSGLSLLFPFEMPLFAWTFEHLNALGVPELLGMATYPEVLTPQEEMQYAQIWHLVVAIGFMCIVLAHIYIGSVGMEGAFDAMGSGQVDAQWAKEHHHIWYDKLKARGEAPGDPAKHPAE
ncbi:formate dehydrogenase subunit gamma [Rhodovulum sp. DZ06]|uniref:formate dehydrogenase subunit gamma n=1 Tax=Rhodovulum sp. DZ06 TaxID=3425126 RepID=UPI003D34A65E